jgi:hypothetical protein
MPAARTSAGPVSTSRFDVVACDSANIAGFIAHVALVDSVSQTLNTGTPIEVVEMGPPLRRSASQQRLDAWGAVPLTVDEQLAIGVFIDERVDEHAAARLRPDEQYVVRPHTTARRSADGTVIYWLFNCVGFAIEAMKASGLNVIVTDESQLPLVSLTTLESQYPDLARLSERMRGRLGIPGSGPWNVMLGGYLLHALNRTSSEIRAQAYAPVSGDEMFV